MLPTQVGIQNSKANHSTDRDTIFNSVGVMMGNIECSSGTDPSRDGAFDLFSLHGLNNELKLKNADTALTDVDSFNANKDDTNPTRRTLHHQSMRNLNSKKSKDDITRDSKCNDDMRDSSNVVASQNGSYTESIGKRRILCRANTLPLLHRNRDNYIKKSTKRSGTCLLRGQRLTYNQQGRYLSESDRLDCKENCNSSQK